MGELSPHCHFQGATRTTHAQGRGSLEICAWPQEKKKMSDSQFGTSVAHLGSLREWGRRSAHLRW